MRDSLTNIYIAGMILSDLMVRNMHSLCKGEKFLESSYDGRGYSCGFSESYIFLKPWNMSGL